MPVRTPRQPFGRAVRVMLSLLVLGMVAGGCSSEVERAASERAERAATVMHRERHGTAADMALRVVGGDRENGTAIEALVAEGERFDGRIVLRITERIDVDGFDMRDPDAVRCYEYDLADGYNFDPSRIDCPDLEPLDLEPSEPEPTIPPGVADALRGRLEALDPRSLNEALVLDAARQVGKQAPIVDVTTSDGVIGVVIWQRRRRMRCWVRRCWPHRGLARAQRASPTRGSRVLRPQRSTGRGPASPTLTTRRGSSIGPCTAPTCR